MLLRHQTLTRNTKLDNEVVKVFSCEDLRFIILMAIDGVDGGPCLQALAEWHCCSHGLLAQTPDQWLPILQRPTCHFLCRNAHDAKPVEVAIRKMFAEWTKAAEDKRSPEMHMLSPKNFKKFWCPQPRCAKHESTAADVEVHLDQQLPADSSEPPSKRQKLFSEAMDKGLLPLDYDKDSKIRSKLLTDKAYVVAHTVIYKLQHGPESTKLMFANAGVWPKADADLTSLPKLLSANTLVISRPSCDEKAAARHLLPREIIAMKGYDAGCLNASTCSRPVQFLLCKHLPYEPVIRSLLTAACRGP